MKFKNSTKITQILEALFDVYEERVPDVRKITEAMIERAMVNDQAGVVNDHIAFRTMGVPNLGITSFEKIFLAHGYTRMDFYHFKAKKLDAYWYAPPSSDLPRVFISELKVQLLSASAQQVIKKYTKSVTSDPVDLLNLNDVNQVADFLQAPLWVLPSKDDYEILLTESEYAAWVIYNRYYLNHYTISVHDLPQEYNTLEAFNIFLKSIGIKLNDSGGEIKISKDGLLRQSSSIANQVEAIFTEGQIKKIAGSYIEFAERNVLPEFAHLDHSNLKRKHRREGFETANADKIFESTFTSQLIK
jgi:hypothetical protein